MAPPGVLIVTGCTALVVAVRCCCCPKTAHRTPCASRAPRCQDRALTCPTGPQKPATPSIPPAASHQQRSQLQTGCATQTPHRGATMPAETPAPSPACCRSVSRGGLLGAPKLSTHRARHRARQTAEDRCSMQVPVWGPRASPCARMHDAAAPLRQHAPLMACRMAGIAQIFVPSRAPARARTRARDTAAARSALRVAPRPAAPHPQGLHRPLFRPNTSMPPPPPGPPPPGGAGGAARATPWRLHTDGRARVNVAGTATGVRAKLRVRARRAPERASMAACVRLEAVLGLGTWGGDSVCLVLPVPEYGREFLPFFVFVCVT